MWQQSMHPTMNSLGQKKPGAGVAVHLLSQVSQGIFFLFPLLLHQNNNKIIKAYRELPCSRHICT
jgi:hypothetical protein